jgi:hypothetical protein
LSVIRQALVTVACVLAGTLVALGLVHLLDGGFPRIDLVVPADGSKGHP